MNAIAAHNDATGDTESGASDTRHQTPMTKVTWTRTAPTAHGTALRRLGYVDQQGDPGHLWSPDVIELPRRWAGATLGYGVAWSIQVGSSIGTTTGACGYCGGVPPNSGHTD